jgi:release factor glutamine methyltransferase
VGTPLREALDGVLVALRAAGVENPRLDAELLVAFALGVPRTRLHTDPDLRVGGAAVRTLQAAVRRRAFEREPLAYITGRRGFRRLDVSVDRRALIPRPETELLVEVAFELPAGARVLDLGTGSGAVALAVKDERPDLSLTASDVSADALSLAGENARRLGLEIELVQSDLLSGLPGRFFEVILANLPYVEEGAPLAPEIARHEPALALLAGADGLDVFRRLLSGDVPAPLLALEVGAGQAGAVASLARAAGFGEVQVRPDLAGIDRVVVARRPC